MIAFRIEHKRTGVGPFNHDADTAGHSAGIEARNIAYQACIPSPWEEHGMKQWRDLSVQDRHRFVFGFSSRRQLRRFFPPMHTRRLRELGFTIAIYRTDNTLTVESASQVAFVKEAAVRLTNPRRVAKRRRARRPRPAINQGGTNGK